MWKTWKERSDWRVFHISMAGSYNKAPQGAPGGCGRFVGKSDAFPDFSINVHGREGAGKISFWKVGYLEIRKTSEQDVTWCLY